jgi:hypothetical protein
MPEGGRSIRRDGDASMIVAESRNKDRQQGPQDDCPSWINGRSALPRGKRDAMNSALTLTPTSTLQPWPDAALMLRASEWFMFLRPEKAQ